MAEPAFTAHLEGVVPYWVATLAAGVCRAYGMAPTMALMDSVVGESYRNGMASVPRRRGGANRRFFGQKGRGRKQGKEASMSEETQAVERDYYGNPIKDPFVIKQRRERREWLAGMTDEQKAAMAAGVETTRTEPVTKQGRPSWPAGFRG